MVNKVDSRAIIYEFEFHWMPLYFRACAITKESIINKYFCMTRTYVYVPLTLDYEIRENVHMYNTHWLLEFLAAKFDLAFVQFLYNNLDHSTVEIS